MAIAAIGSIVAAATGEKLAVALSIFIAEALKAGMDTKHLVDAMKENSDIPDDLMEQMGREVSEATSHWKR